MRFLLPILLLATPAFAEVGVLGSVGVSTGLGEEHGLAPGASIHYRTDHSEAAVSYDSANKYTHAGWRLAGYADFRRPGRWSPMVGVEYTWRNGGPWIKKALWLRGGVAFESVRLVLAQDHGTKNQVGRTTIDWTLSAGDRWLIRGLVGLERFRQPQGSEIRQWGQFATWSVGLRF